MAPGVEQIVTAEVGGFLVLVGFASQDLPEVAGYEVLLYSI